MAGDLNRWSQAAIDDARQRVHGELAAFPVAAAAEAFLLARVTQLAEDLTPKTSVLRFHYVVALARHLLDHPRGNDAEFTSLLEVAHGLLRVEGITSTSMLSHLLAELHALEARRLSHAGEIEPAAWQLLTGERQAQRSRHEVSSLERLLALAKLRFRLGHTSFAVSAFQVIEEADDADLKRRAAIWKVRALRLSGDIASAREVLKEVQARHGQDGGTRMLLEWEAAAIEAIATGKLDSLLKAASKDDPRYTAANLITISLWTKATKSRAYLGKMVKTRTIRRAFPGEIPRLGSEHAALAALEALESSYDNEIPLDVRLSGLGNVLSTRRDLARVEWELLVLAAAARSLSRLSQDAMADFFVSEYRALSLTVSNGKSPDVLSVVPDLLAKPWFRASSHRQAGGA